MDTSGAGIMHLAAACRYPGVDRGTRPLPARPMAQRFKLGPQRCPIFAICPALEVLPRHSCCTMLPTAAHRYPQRVPGCNLMKFTQDHEAAHWAVTGEERNHARNRNAKCGIAVCAEGSVWLCISAPFSPIVISTTRPSGRATRSSFPRTVYRAGVVSECDIEVVPLKPIVRSSRTIVFVQVPSSSSTNVSATIDVIRV